MNRSVVALVMACGCASACHSTKDGPTNIAQGNYDSAIETLAQKLEKYYLFPDAGSRYAAMLRRNVTDGVYKDFATVPDIGAKVTADLQAVAPDPHLIVASVGGSRGPGPAATDGGPAEIEPPIAGARWVADGVAAVRINALQIDAQSTAALQAFLTDYVTAKAIILDLRGNHGGDLDPMLVMFPYFFAQLTVLLDMDYNQKFVDDNGVIPGQDGKPALQHVDAPAGIYRLQHVAIPNPTEHRLFGAQIFCLISSTTASAGEHLADALKCSGRATLIGEHTAGAGHFAMPTPLSSELGVNLPVGQTICPKTGLGWEGIGVEPDVTVPADTALDEALARVH